MIEDNTVYLLHKYIDIELAFKLSSSEFRCQCTRITCNKTLFSPKLKKSWDKSRKEFDKPLTINSGFRCQAHNEDVGGVPNSKHTTGEAIDISHDEFSVEETLRLKEILNKNFDVVIDYPTFYHCHNN